MFRDRRSGGVYRTRVGYAVDQTFGQTKDTFSELVRGAGENSSVVKDVGYRIFMFSGVAGSVILSPLQIAGEYAASFKSLERIDEPQTNPAPLI